MKLAIIDRGVEKTHRRLENATISGITIEKNQLKDFVIIEDKFCDIDGHGTAIASIIHKINPNVHLVAIKLLGPENVITEDLLAEGISYCSKIPDIELINVSMGIPTNNPSQALVKACDEAIKSGKVIVAASHPFPDKKCYPAAFPLVFGVATGLVKSKMNYKYLGKGAVNVLAKGTTQRIAWKENSFRIGAGTSYATAHFCALLSHKMNSNGNFKRTNLIKKVIEDSDNEIEELNYLKNYEVQVVDDILSETKKNEAISLYKPFSNISFAKKVAMFPYTEKENSTIVNFRNNIPLEIVAYIDYPRSFSKINGFQLGDDSLNDKIIKRNLVNRDYEIFDTLIVGYYLDQTYDINVIFGNKIVYKCIQLNKNFILWDKNVYFFIKKIIKKNYPGYSGTIYFQSVDLEMDTYIKQFRFLPEVNVPVIGVIGTGSKQGKVTTQLRIKEILQNSGYKVSHLSTEPQGAVLGANFSFPYGYKSSVQLKQELWPSFVETTMRLIQEANKPNIIVSGIQGGLLPRATVNPKHKYLLNSLNFIVSLKPDGIVCAINPMDDIDLIKKTIETLKSFVRFRLLFFVITPWYRDFLYIHNQYVSNYKILSENELTEKIRWYQKELGVPVLDIMDKRNSDLVLHSIQNAFS